MNPFLERVIAIRAEEQRATAFRSEVAARKRSGGEPISADNLMATLNALGLTMADAAELCSVSRATFEYRRRYPPAGWCEHVERSLYLEAGALRG